MFQINVFGRVVLVVQQAKQLAEIVTDVNSLRDSCSATLGAMFCPSARHGAGWKALQRSKSSFPQFRRRRQSPPPPLHGESPDHIIELNS
jgi:hypothetical protein